MLCVHLNLRLAAFSFARSAGRLLCMCCSPRGSRMAVFADCCGCSAATSQAAVCPFLPFAVDADATGTERDQNGKGETAGETARALPIRNPCNLLKSLEAGTGIEPVFTDLQSAA